MSKVRAWREREGYTRPELAALLGAIEPSTIWRWELPESHPDSRRPRDSATLYKLYRLSRGEITADSFYDWPDIASLELPLGDREPPPPPAPLLDGVAAAELQDEAA